MRSDAPSRLEISDRDELSIFGCVGNLVFGITRGQSLPEQLEKRRQFHASIRDRYPEGYVFMNVVMQGSPMPNAATRASAAALTKEFSKHILAHAIVFEGQGTWLSGMRMIARTMTLAMGTRHRMNIFATTDDAIPWLHREAGAKLSVQPAACVRALHEARANW